VAAQGLDYLCMPNFLIKRIPDIGQISEFHHRQKSGKSRSTPCAVDAEPAQRLC
jgi:hypothetical protein